MSRPAAAIAGPALLVLVLATGAGWGLSAPLNGSLAQEQPLPQGTQVAGITVTALTPAAARDHVAAAWDTFAQEPWTLESAGGTLTIAPATIGLAPDWDALQTELAALHPAPRNGWERLQQWVAPPVGQSLPLPVAVDQERYAAWYATAKAALDQPPSDARYDWDTLAVVPEQTGWVSDPGQWQGLLDDPLTKLAPRTIQLPMTEAQPAIRTADLDQLDLEEPFSSFTTMFDLRQANRSHNIAQAVRAWEGYVIPPGGRISFNEVVGKRSEANGYKKAPVYEFRRVTEGLGGGICQVSTTLYNAVLLGGLEILQRGGHSRPCAYAPPGRDATVDWPNRDLVFRNPYTFPLFVRTHVEQGKVTFQLFGDPAQRPNLVLEEEVTWLSDAGAPEEVFDPALPPGTRQVADAGFRGRQIVVTRIWDPGRESERREVVSRDRITALRGIVRVHPADGQAPASAAGGEIVDPVEDTGDAPQAPMPF